MAVGFRTFRVRESTAVSEADRDAARKWMDPCGCRAKTITGPCNGPPGLLARDRPPLEPAAVVLLGHRPDELHADVACENARLDPAIHAPTAPEVRERGAASVGADAAARLAERPAWLHLDLDVLDECALPGVSYPQPLGLD
jgi:arginase